MDRLWSDPTDRLLVVLALIALAVFVGWYSLSAALAMLRIPLTGDPMPYFFASVWIPASSSTALVLLLGWGIQKHRPGPQGLFLGFVILELLASAIGIGVGSWFYWSLRSGPGPLIEMAQVLAGLGAVVVAAHAVAVFLLLLLVLLGRTPAPPSPGILPPPAPPSS